MNNDFEYIFNYVYRESYKNIDTILKNNIICNILTENNNNYYMKLKKINPNIEDKQIKAYCFTILYLLKIMNE